MSDLLQRTGTNLLRAHRRLVRAHPAEAMPGAFTMLLADPIRRMSDTLRTLLEAASDESVARESTEDSAREGSPFTAPPPPVRAGAVARRVADAFSSLRTAAPHLPMVVRPSQPAARTESPQVRRDAASTRTILTGIDPGERTEGRPHSLPLSRTPVPAAEGEGSPQRPARIGPSAPAGGIPRTVPPRPASTVTSRREPVPPPAHPSRPQEPRVLRALPPVEPSRQAEGNFPPLSQPASRPVAEGRAQTRMAMGAPELGAVLQANLAAARSSSPMAEELDTHAAAVLAREAPAAPQVTPSFAVSSPSPIPAAADVEAVLEELEQRLRLELLRAYGTSGA